MGIVMHGGYHGNTMRKLCLMLGAEGVSGRVQKLTIYQARLT